jgi:hypothetical protein
MFEQMKRDAALRKFDRLLVWKVSRLGRDMREVIATVYELADLGVLVFPVKSQTGPHHLHDGQVVVGNPGMVRGDGKRRTVGGDTSRPGASAGCWKADWPAESRLPPRLGR